MSKIMEQLPASSGKEWRQNREKGELVQLPFSGRFVRIRTVRPDTLIRLGKIPNVLTTLVLNMIYDRGEEDKFEKFLSDVETKEEALEMLESLRIVCVASMIEPKVVENPQKDDEISIEDLDLGDRSYIFRLAFVPAEALSTFRYKPPSDVAVMANGEGNPQPTV